MASKNTKAKNKTELADVPVHPLTLIFQWVINPSISMIGNILTKDLPPVVTRIATIQRLKGCAHDPEVKKAFDFVGREQGYDIQKVKVETAKTDAPIEVSWSTLSTTESAIKWMLSNGQKLYLTATERLVNAPFKDRNFTELCGGLFQFEDLTKVYGSKSMVKSVKEDIKFVTDARKIQDEVTYSTSPMRKMADSLRAIEGIAEAVEARRAEVKALSQARKLKLLTEAKNTLTGK
jgi:hypothetical protein